MNLEEIRTLLRLRDAPPKDCGDVNALLDAPRGGHVAMSLGIHGHTDPHEVARLPGMLRGCRSSARWTTTPSTVATGINDMQHGDG